MIGNGVSMDQTEGRRYLKIAADNGYAVAQFNVAISYSCSIFENGSSSR
jgi:hypothetical protein